MTYPKLTDEPGALALAAQIRLGELSPVEAVDAAINRIEQMDGPINAVVVRDFDRARDAAKAAGEAIAEQPAAPDRPLLGVPMTIKESFDIAGLPTSWGHEKFKGNIAKRDSRIVTQLKSAGAIILGKSNVPPDLTDWQSNNPAYGRTQNPHDLTRSPGGSSGGAAAAVACGMVPCEIGTDIGGSVRVPAHFCGTWGHKPSWGLLSKHGHDHPVMAGQDAHDGVLSVAGPLARNAQDLRALVQITATLPIIETPLSLQDCRILAVLDQEVSPVDDSVRAPLENAFGVMERAGAKVDRSSPLLPDLTAQHRDYMRMLGVALARGAAGPDGKSATAADWFDLLDAQARSEAQWAHLFETYDFVIAPPAPIAAFAHDDTPVRQRKVAINGEERNFGEVFAWAGISTFPNLPSTVLPIGAYNNLPIGAQIIGPRWGDLDCIEAARQLGDLLEK